MLTAGLCLPAKAADFYFADTNTALNQASSWIGGVKPVDPATDVAVFSSNTVARSPNTGSSFADSWLGMVVTNSSFKWTLTDEQPKSLRIGSAGIILAGGNGADVEIQTKIILLTNQIWHVADSIRTLTAGRTTNAVSGAFSLTKTGAGKLVLGATNTFGGGLIINGGTVNVAVDNALGDGLVTINDGAVLAGSGKAVTNSIVIGAGSVSVNEDIVLSGSVSGSGSITHSGSNSTVTLSLAGNNSGFSGGIINNAAVSVGHKNALGTGAVTLNNLSALSAGIALTGTSAISNSMVLNGSASVAGSFDCDLTGTISGIGSLTKSGSGVLTLSAANTYTGGTVVSNGVLVGKASGCFGSRFVKVMNGAALTLTNSANCIGDSARLILNPSSVLNLNFTGADTVGGISLDGGVTWLPSGTYTAAALGASGSGSLTIGESASVLVYDSFSGTSGAALADSTLDTGGIWSKNRTDNGTGMNGNFIFAAGGGAVVSNNQYANMYTAFNVSSNVSALTDGVTLSLTFTANGYTNGSLTLGFAETLDKGYFSNVATNDLIRFAYSLGGTKPGTFSWSVRDASVLLNSDDSVRAGAQTINPTDVVRLSITVYPKFGLIFGAATNVTQNYLISKSRIGVNTPGLTNMLYAGMGWLSIETNSEVPAVISSFAITTAPDLTDSKPLSLSVTLPPVMTGFAFDDMNSTANTNFAYILSEHAPIDIMHAVRESVYDTVRATYPEKIIIKQLAWGGTAGISLDTIWPGHCLMKAGTKVTADVEAVTNNTVLTLQDYTRIVSKQSTIDGLIADKSADAYVLLYGLDGTGRPDWSRAEHVKMVSLNTTNGTLTVQRGQLGTVPLAFTNGQTAIARHMMFWTPSQWELNLSLESPRGGPFNMTAAEWFGLQVAQIIYKSEADGIEMDVGRWMWGYPANNPMDCDNDLVADHGYINGICSFGLGGQVLQRTLRELLGPNRIVQTDGNDALFGQRGWKYMNGVQLESFPTGGYDVYSERFRHFRQWVNSVDTQPAFSYAFTKTPTTLFGHVVDTNNNNASYDWRFRVGFAAALLTGMPHPFASVTDITFDPANPDYNDPNMQEDKGFYKWDEYVGGGLNDWKWLGAPQGVAVQVNNNVGSTNLLASAVWQWKTESNFVSSCSITNGEYSAVITAIPSNTLPWIDKTYYPNSQVPKALWFGTRLEITSGVPVLVTNQEYTLEFEAKGNDSWTVNGQTFDRVPRSLTIDGISSNGFHKPASVFLGPEWTQYRFTIIADSNAPPPLVFGVSEQIGEAAIRNIRLYQGGSERWMREFKNGRLYLNMTLEPWVVNVGTGVVQRLVGTQVPELNNGAVENGILTIPSWDAVYLRTWTVEAWKSANFTSNQLTNAVVSGDSADPDGDGFNNYQEYIAGTNPTNALSQFVVGSGVDRAKLNWSSVSGRVYEVYWTSNLLSSFTPLQTNIVWPQSVYTNAVQSGTGSGFYKMKVRRP